MSVQSEIDRISENVASTYTALSEMGATMPAQQNSDNLPGAVRTVPQGSGKSVQTDWNQMDETAPDYLKNKPFGDMPTGGDTLYWDGNTEGLVCVADMVYKVSDAVPTADDVANGCVGTAAAGVVELHFSDTGNGILLEDNGLAVIVSDSGIGIDMGGFAFQEAGTYLNGTLNVKSFTIPGYTGFPVTKKIEKKYLPGAVILYTDGTYLYDSDDTTDETNRTTAERLKAHLNSGMTVYVYATLESLGVPMFCHASAIGLVDMGGPTIGAVGVNYSTSCAMYYTAEYTAS